TNEHLNTKQTITNQQPLQPHLQHNKSLLNPQPTNHQNKNLHPKTQSTTLNLKTHPINTNPQTLVHNNTNSNNQNNPHIIFPKSTPPKPFNTTMPIAAIQPNSTHSKNLNDL
ncbi:hypothetical protein, partial [Staphylococcus aureus]|uniref:hypothetical protein n=1 Tax=Staphylococcus aureus TaxID=1280 RepID=UPI001C930CB4